MVKRHRDLPLVVLILAVIAVSVQLQPRDLLTPRIGPDTILGIQGVCLGDSRERVEQVLGNPGHVEYVKNCGHDQICHALYYGLHDPTVWTRGHDIFIGLDGASRVVGVTGIQLTERRGQVLCGKGTSESDLHQRLGRPDCVSYSGNNTNEYHHFKNWRLVVLVDRKTRRTTDFTLEEKFPAEPADGEMNTKK